MMTSTYILPDVYNSSYELDAGVEIKSEDDSDDSYLLDASAGSSQVVKENEINSEECEINEDFEELEEEPLVEINSITVPQDLVVDKREPTLLLFVDSASSTCISGESITKTTKNRKLPLYSSASQSKLCPDEITQRKAVTKALRSIKTKSNAVVSKVCQPQVCISSLKPNPSKVEGNKGRGNKSENLTNSCRSQHLIRRYKSSNQSKEIQPKTVVQQSNSLNGESGKIFNSVREEDSRQNKINIKPCSNIPREDSYTPNTFNSSQLTMERNIKSSCKIKTIANQNLCQVNDTEVFKEKDTSVQSVLKSKDNKLSCVIRTMNDVGDDLVTKSKPDFFSCTVCGKQFREKSHLATHSRAHIDDRNFKCNDCGNSFKAKANLLLHLKSHEGAPYICEKCDKTFPERKMLMRHIRVVHSGEGKYKCDLCNRFFKSSQKLDLHYTIHTGNKPFSCSLCGKSFVYKTTYSAHMRAHAADDAFSCELCPDTENKGELRRRCHHFSEARPWLCTICGKGYLLKATLKNHMKTHNSERAFKCDECGKAFVKKQAYDSHVKTHSGENPQFMCDQCSQSYFNVSSLKRHYMKHISEKKFICDICSKSFWTKDALKVHKRSHDSVKMFHCTQCSKSFAHKHTLMAHSKSHTSENSLSYGSCPNTFIHKYSSEHHDHQHTMRMNHAPSSHPPPSSIFMMPPAKHLDFSTLHIL